MNQNIITYLSENKEKYPQDVLAAELRKSGYEEGDIAEGVAQVFGGAVSTVAPAKTSFWNFKDKKVYTKASEKWADFLFGFFAPKVFSVVIGRITLTLGMIGALFEIVFWVTVAVYWFNRRRFMFYGAIVPIITTIGAFLFLTSMFRHGF